jgi:hypothetical protein
MRNNLLTQQDRQWAEQYWFAEEQTFGASTPKVSSKHQHQPALLIIKECPAWLLRGHFPSANAGKVNTRSTTHSKKSWNFQKKTTFQLLNDFGVIFLSCCKYAVSSLCNSVDDAQLRSNNLLIKSETIIQLLSVQQLNHQPSTNIITSHWLFLLLSSS